ncbi:MAG: hypothetical protein IPN34_13070 [Planctomycetes bacterium]|nr:hypothetical protein [Planctomycetota bacterium]
MIPWRWRLALAALWLTSCGEELEPPASGVASLVLEGARQRSYDLASADALSGFTVERGEWVLADADGARVLLQRKTDELFCWIHAPEPASARDVDVSVRFRPLSGKEDASGGIAIRGEGDRYLVIRGNGLEHNFRAYLHGNGRREVAAGTSIAPIAIGEWHTLRVVALAERVQAWLDGELLLDFETALVEPGWVGLWTKADAVTEFADLRVAYR